jgi:hypothetical protein
VGNGEDFRTVASGVAVSTFGSMDVIDKLFDALDEFRHLPAYQLERRADIFFALFLKGVLEKKTGFSLMDKIVPEFPLKVMGTNHSTKVDYLMVSEELKEVFLIELKTDASSLRDKQTMELVNSAKRRFYELARDVLDIAANSKEWRKYYQLLLLLESVKVVEFSMKMNVSRKSDFLAQLKNVTVRNVNPVIKSVLIFPDCNNKLKSIKLLQEVDYRITLAEFADSVRSQGGTTSERFATSLIRWDKEKAGCAVERGLSHL